MSPLRLATRRSPLALVQAETVRARLVALGHESEVVLIDTAGDRRRDVPLESVGGSGIFAVEIQRAIFEGIADVAVHSAKDLPSSTPRGLVLACVTDRRDPADALVGLSLSELALGATVATGSPRRKALLLERRPDLNVVGLRGNLDTRLTAVARDGIDAIITAVSALERMGQEDLVSERLDTAWFVPQVGQGVLAMETRASDEVTFEILSALIEEEAMGALLIERAFLQELGAGCSIPAGALATICGDVGSVSGVMVAVDGSRSVRASIEGAPKPELGRQLAVTLRDHMEGASLPGWEAR